MEKENNIMIRGFPVSFPKGRKPFAPQLALMSKLLVGMQKGENCLLESPTGTGKTLALLCAALAWQQQQKEQAVAVESDCESEDGEPLTAGVSREPLQSFDDFRYVQPEKKKAPVELAYEEGVAPSAGKAPVDPACFYDDDDDDDVFESPKKKRQKNPDADPDLTAPASNASPPVPDPPEDVDPPDCDASEGTDMNPPDSSGSLPKTETPVVTRKKQKKIAKKTKRLAPRVYFCSRTHSQLNQVVAELRTCRAAFQNTTAVGVGDDGRPFSMTLLASRKSTCINKEACSDPKGIDDACKRLLKEKACSYYRRAKWGQTKLPPVWDIEDAVRLGKSSQACPYYTARDSMATADLVLCPYNYIVDPGVREIMGINLKDAVVIFDEAHNLEDSAREAASAKLSLRALANAAGELYRLGAKSGSLAPSYDLLRGMIVGVQSFLEEEDSCLNIGSYEKAHKVFKGTEALGLMQSRAGVTSESLVHLREALSMVVNENASADPYALDQDEDEIPGQSHNGDVLSSGSVHVTASLVKVLGFLLADGMENVEHYKMVVLRERGPWEPAASRGRRGRNRAGAGSITTMETYLCFWCQSASTCFSEIDKQVHSVVLTSGTLSPLDSFAGELGIEFPHRLEANHVINVKKQCLVTSVGFCGGVSLDARYSNQHDLKYQDALGSALVQHARVVPGGILVFFPSYGLMDKMHDRWKVTGLLQALEGIKGVHLEPRGQGKIDGVLAEYYGDITEARESKENTPPGSRTGAVMLAVARGKVSEGIDFSDDAARMCMIIGIPYPSSKDLQVMLKKEYQDQRRTRNPRLVGGRAWYSLQAFRAVNQAVGRCIRHRTDFGAIVLCDPRYASSRETTASLSKWVRSSVKQCKSVEMSLPQVDAFFQQHQQQVQRRVEPLNGSPCSSCCGNAGGGDAGGGCCSNAGGQTGDGGGGGQEQKPEANARGSGSPEPGLVQQSLSQMFRNSSALYGSVPTAGAATGRSVSIIEGTNGRTAFQLLSQGTNDVPRDTRTPPPDARADPVRAPRRQDGVLRCRNGTLLVSNCRQDAISGVTNDRPRQVLVRANSHLSRTSASLSPGFGDASASSSRVSTGCRGGGATLLEVPRGFKLPETVAEGEGQWVADDGIVYAPLHCLCSGCRSAQVGDKAVGAGLGGQGLIGRAWFYASRVQAVGIVDDGSSPVELALPERGVPSLANPMSVEA
ncbi:unnamed protein product [Scytosiphon promiscuus]